METETVSLSAEAWDELVTALKSQASDLQNSGSQYPVGSQGRIALHRQSTRLLVIALDIDRQRSALTPIASRKA